MAKSRGAQSYGKAFGGLCGALGTTLLMTLALTEGIVYLAHLSGLADLGHAALERRLQAGDASLVLIDLLIRLVVFAGTIIGSIITLVVYYKKYIKPDPERYLRKNTIVPDDLKGRWRYPVTGCSGDWGTCCCFTWCGLCTLSEHWFRAGFLHAVLGGVRVEFVGWQWIAGMVGFCITSNFAGCCMPCGFAVLRGGIGFIDGGDGGLGDIIPLRKRFEIPHEGWGTFISDFCVHCWCSPCADTQEFRQVKELLDRNPQEATQAANVGTVVVGAPVSVIAPVENEMV